MYVCVHVCVIYTYLDILTTTMLLLQVVCISQARLKLLLLIQVMPILQ
jgi:hypothetical protein